MADRRYIHPTTGEITEDVAPRPFEDAFAQIVDEVSLSVPTHVHYGRS